MTSEFAAEVRKSAEQAFASGLYCAESVVVALAKAQGIENTLLPRAATAFCSGMARSCGTCGALTGAMMGISLSLGRDEAGAPVQPVYDATRRLIAQFEQTFGARNCDALLGCDLGTPEGQAVFRENQLGKHCARYTAGAAEMAAELLAESRQ